MFIIIAFTFPLYAEGEIYYGLFSGGDTLYNSDAFLSTSVVLLERGAEFYVKYSTLLEMAEQQGKVILDPMYATYSIVFGIRFFWHQYFNVYIDHYCRHLIDRDLNEGKVVFNGEFYQVSNVKTLYHEFLKPFYRFTYGFYPQGIFVDWLNSRPFYRHRFNLVTGIPFKKHFNAGFDFEFTISNDKPPITYMKVIPWMRVFASRKNRVIYAFVKYNLVNTGPIRSPEGLFFFGTGFRF